MKPSYAVGENIAGLLDDLARKIPGRPAVIETRPDSRRRITFRKLAEDSRRLAGGLRAIGITPRQRVLLMVPSGIDFISLTFALFRLGAVPTLIDPGLGRRNVLNCVQTASPEAMIAVPAVHAVRQLVPGSFANLKRVVTVGRRWFWGGPTLNQIRRRGKPVSEETGCKPDDPAAILFTSGSTGPAKGVVYTHRMFYHQVALLREMFGIQMGEVDLPTFPLFALFGVALGMTCVIPDMDSTRPAEVNPQTLLNSLGAFSVSSSFGSPALWNTVIRYAVEHNVTLPHLKRVLMAGAPVPGDLMARFEGVVPDDACIHTPYGATEALPVTSIDRREVLGETWERTRAGHGTCVGRPVPGLELKIIRLTDEVLEHWSDDLELPVGEIGEVVVKAPWVTREYFHLEDATRRAKIIDGDGFWHRMGDTGYLDPEGRLWFCGRKSHRVESANQIWFTIPCEAIFNTHPAVRRSALVGLGENGDRQPAIVIELEEKSRVRDTAFRRQLTQELLELGAKHDVTRAIRTIFFHPGFPVDVRHNAKIDRERLARWTRRPIAGPKPAS